MLSHRLTPLLLTSLLAVTEAAGQQPRDVLLEPSRVALVIGNQRYGRPEWTLKNPENDARRVADSLRDSGFRVELALNQDKRALDAAIGRFTRTIPPGSVAVFYYAGHGVQIEGDNYLVPVDFVVDFNTEDESDLKYAAYPTSRLLSRLESSGARLKLIILDACRNNPFHSTRRGGSLGGLAPITNTGKGTFIAYATAPNSTASDNPKDANGLFTKHLVESMRMPGLSLYSLFLRVAKQVSDESEGKQLPWISSSVTGDFWFHPPADGTASPQGRVDSASAGPAPNRAADRNSSEEAEKLIQRGNAREAVGLLNLAIQNQPEDAGLYHLRGQAYARLQEFERAIQDFDQEMKRLQPASERVYLAYHERGVCHRKLKHYEQAVHDLSEALRRRPDQYLSYHERGVAYQSEGKLDLALQDYTRAIEIRPDYVWPYIDRAGVRRMRGEYALALRDLNKAIDLDPANPVAYSGRAEVKAAMGDKQGARADQAAAGRLSAKE